MLDIAHGFTPAGLPQLVVYPDDADPARFYVLARAPRIATDATGQPLISLLLYGHQEAGTLQIQGGLCTLTTTLGLTADEESALPAALAARPEAPRPAGPAAAGYPEWRGGTVQLTLLPGLEARGTPALAGANNCVLSLNLDAAQAEGLQAAWAAGLPDSRICYDLRVTAAHQAATRAVVDAASGQAGPDGESLQQETAAVEVRAVTAVEVPLTVQGPVSLPPTALQSRVQVVGL